MDNLQIFKYEDKNVRTVMRDGEPWWVLKDVCDVLGLSNPTIVAQRLDDDEVSKIDPKLDLGSVSNTPITVVNEMGLYNVILRSDKPEAKVFKRWITHEVLPSIRKTGAYMTPKTIDEWLKDPDAMIQVLQQYKAEKEKNSLLETALNISLDYYTVAKYNREYHMYWTMEECQKIGKAMTAYCRGNAIEIRRCETNDERFGVVNSYPLKAWQKYLQKYSQKIVDKR